MMLWMLLLDELQIAAGFAACREQRAFGGIAQCFPAAFFLDEIRVVAAEEQAREFKQGRGV